MYTIWAWWPCVHHACVRRLVALYTGLGDGGVGVVDLAERELAGDVTQGDAPVSTRMVSAVHLPEW
jgi:hypothetical protein